MFLDAAQMEPGTDWAWNSVDATQDGHVRVGNADDMIVGLDCTVNLFQEPVFVSSPTIGYGHLGEDSLGFLGENHKENPNNHHLIHLHDTITSPGLPQPAVMPWKSWTVNGALGEDMRSTSPAPQDLPAAQPAPPPEELSAETTPQPLAVTCPLGCGTLLTVVRTGLMNHIRQNHAGLVPRSPSEKGTCPKRGCSKNMKWSSFTQHVLAHLVDAAGGVVCPACGSTFSRYGNYTRHVKDGSCPRASSTA